MNRTIIERVRCILKTTKLPKVFWSEVAPTTCYLINRFSSGPLNFEVPEKAWIGKDVSYFHLRVFGCKIFVHVHKEERSKLDDKVVPHVFFGYGDEKFGFRLWDPTKKQLVSRDVVFQEDQTLGDFDKAKKSKGTSDDLVELVPIPSSLEQPRNEEKEIDELPRDDSASDILAQELVEHEEQEEQSVH